MKLTLASEACIKRHTKQQGVQSIAATLQFYNETRGLVVVSAAPSLLISVTAFFCYSSDTPFPHSQPASPSRGWGSPLCFFYFHS